MPSHAMEGPAPVWGIIGAGAVGGFYGFRLARAGQSVLYLTRGATLEALRRDGLRVTSDGAQFTVAVRATADPEELQECAVIFVAVKNPDLQQALEMTRRALQPRAFAVTLQNGIGAPAKASEALGEGRVVAGIAYLGCARVGPGEIVHTGLGRLTVGEPGGGSSARCRGLAARLEACGIPTRASARIEEDLWKKLAWNAAFNGPTALARCPPAALLRQPESQALCRALVEEVAAAARIRGILLPPDLPDEILRMSETLTDLRTSMLQDLEAGRPSEIEALYLETLRILEGAGLPAAAHRAVAGMLAAAETGFSAPRCS